MYSKINLMLPTYKRIKCGRLPRFISSVMSTAGDIEKVRISLLVNGNDYETLNYLHDLQLSENFLHILTTYEPHPHLAKFFNRLYEGTRFNAPDTLVSMLGDDMEFNTVGWDHAILEAANEDHGWKMVYCNDDFLWRCNLCVNLFVGRKVVDATGKPFMCPDYPADFIDVIQMYTGQMANIMHYLDNVHITHNHATKDGIDATWERLRSRIDVPKNNRKRMMEYAAKCAEEILRAKVKEERNERENSETVAEDCKRPCGYLTGIGERNTQKTEKAVDYTAG